MSLLFSPRRFFDEIDRSHQLGPLLVILRWGMTASFVILPLWLFRIPPFVSPWLPIHPHYYHFWELLFILPFGAILTVILTVIALAGLRLEGRRGANFKAVFAVVSYGLFLPWTVCLLWDVFLVFTGRWTLTWAAPLHTAAVIAEAALSAWGFHRVFGTPWSRAVFISIVNALVFIGLSALVVR